MKFHIPPQKYLLRLLAILLPVLFVFWAFDVRLAVRRYVIDAEDISSGIRIALVTDLHSCYYGKDQSGLIRSIDSTEPDLVLLGGDIFDDDLPDTNTERFLAGVADRYPCYYVTGNHEYWSDPDKFAVQMSILREYGVTVLSGECVSVSANGERINICGVDDPEAFGAADRQREFAAQLERASAAAGNGSYTVLLSHRPEYFDEYAACGFDLVLSGHAHGGQWRLPLIVNGLYAPNQGWFPPYAGGQYTQAGTTMIVSRGLARESTRIPRIFNRPEWLLIEIR